MKEKKEINKESILSPPKDLSEGQKEIWIEFVKILEEGTNYKKTDADRELILQYVNLKILRDRAWQKFNENPERYVRIVTGICSDGKTPKIVVKENEHYKTFMESNKQLEKILTDLRLTPKARKPKWI